MSVRRFAPSVGQHQLIAHLCDHPISRDIVIIHIGRPNVPRLRFAIPLHSVDLVDRLIISCRKHKLCKQIQDAQALVRSAVSEAMAWAVMATMVAT
jgi:hypothetical protein